MPVAEKTNEGLTFRWIISKAQGDRWNVLLLPKNHLIEFKQFISELLLIFAHPSSYPYIYPIRVLGCNAGQMNHVPNPLQSFFTCPLSTYSYRSPPVSLPPLNEYKGPNEIISVFREKSHPSPSLKPDNDRYDCVTSTYLLTYTVLILISYNIYIYSILFTTNHL